MIVEMHGVVDSGNNALVVNRNMIERQTFERNLRAAGTRFVSVHDIRERDAVALTIDDSTQAAADAAAIVLEAGHEVTIFVNPSNIEAGLDYPFVQLNSLLDEVDVPVVRYAERSWPLTENADREKFRRFVKSRMLTLRTEEERHEFVHTLQAELGIAELDVPPHLKTMTLKRLDELAAAGAVIGSHGWTHRPYAILDADEFMDEFERADEWIRRRFPNVAAAFAVPDGKALPPKPLSTHQFGLYLLADDRLWPGGIGRGVINRASLDWLGPEGSSLNEFINRTHGLEVN